MNKVIHPYDVIKKGTKHPAFCKIEYNNGKLSITGVVHPYRNGNSWGGCGQIVMEFKEFDARGYMTINDVVPENGMTKDSLKLFLQIWDEYHLNDMSPACEHQKKMGWNTEPLDPTRPTSDYIKHPDGHKGWNLKGWVYPPHGYLTKPCPICGYKYGTAWKTFEVPTWAIEFLESLPLTDITPAWV